MIDVDVCCVPAEPYRTHYPFTDGNTSNGLPPGSDHAAELDAGHTITFGRSFVQPENCEHVSKVEPDRFHGDRDFVVSRRTDFFFDECEAS